MYIDRVLVISFKVINGGKTQVTEGRRAVSWYLMRQRRSTMSFFSCRHMFSIGRGRRGEGGRER